jgi:hypothetical protein
MFHFFKKRLIHSFIQVIKLSTPSGIKLVEACPGIIFFFCKYILLFDSPIQAAARSPIVDHIAAGCLFQQHHEKNETEPFAYKKIIRDQQNTMITFPVPDRLNISRKKGETASEGPTWWRPKGFG